MTAMTAQECCGPNRRTALARATPSASIASASREPAGSIGAAHGSSACTQLVATARVASALAAARRSQPRTVPAGLSRATAIARCPARPPWREGLPRSPRQRHGDEGRSSPAAAHVPPHNARTSRAGVAAPGHRRACGARAAEPSHGERAARHSPGRRASQQQGRPRLPLRRWRPPASNSVPSHVQTASRRHLDRGRGNSCWSIMRRSGRPGKFHGAPRPRR